LLQVMIKVSLIYFLPISDATNKKREEVLFNEEISLNGLLRYLIELHGENLAKYFFNNNNEFESRCLILVNKIFINDLEQLICDGDEISFIPPLGGG